MMANKIERSINWEQDEKQLLRDIIKPYRDIISHKDLSTNTNKAKLNAWKEITEKFNTANVRKRDKKQLMNQWKSFKIASKKEISDYRRELNKTGGGPKPPSPSPETLELIDLIPQEFEVDTNEFDCDGVQLKKEKGFNFGESSYKDMHNFRVIENERQQKEHELRMKNATELHHIVMENLRLQKEILLQTLESLKKQ